VLLVAKPAGPTSHDAVDQVRRVLGMRRVGHLGTLDPFAAGLLVVVVGRATRLAQYAGGWTKGYEGTLRLGATTSTDDLTGEVTATSEAWRGLDAGAIDAAFARFVGETMQRPPAFSAVKVGGVRAYKRARRGETVEPVERPVAVDAFAPTAIALPDVRFRAEVSAGTYLRGLARDVGAALGCGAHLTALTRTRVGPFALRDAKAPAEVTPADVRDSAVLLADLPRRDLTDAERGAVAHGRPIEGRGKGEEGRVALFADGQLLAVAEAVGDVLKPQVVLTDA
jgi:tRNA pseudouridine55 synthase